MIYTDSHRTTKTILREISTHSYLICVNACQMKDPDVRDEGIMDSNEYITLTRLRYVSEKIDTKRCYYNVM